MYIIYVNNTLPLAHEISYGGPQVSRHKQEPHGTNKNVTAQTRTSRHKEESHGTNKNLTAQTKASRHKQEPHGTKTSRHKLKVHGTKQELHGTKQNFMAQEQDILHSRCKWRWSVYIDQCLQTYIHARHGRQILYELWR